MDEDYPAEVIANLGKFITDLMREDDLGAVIRAHIRLEHLVRESVLNMAPHPEHIKRLRIDYDGLITLALVFGMHERLGPPLRALGKLRNNFAHKPDTELTKQAVSNLYGSLSPTEKEHVQTSFRNFREEYNLTDAERFAELSAGDQFKLIAIALWGAAQAMLMLSIPR